MDPKNATSGKLDSKQQCHV